MRRRGLLLAAIMLLIAPALAGAVPLTTITVTGIGTYDAVGSFFTGDVAGLSVVNAPRNNGDYLPNFDPTLGTPNYDPALGPIQVFADVGNQFLYTNSLEFPPAAVGVTGEPATAPFTNADTGSVFNMPYFFLQFGLGTFSVDAAGIITGAGVDFKNDPSFDVGVRSPFFTFFGIDAPNEEYNFRFDAAPVAGAAGYTFTLTNTPVPEPGTMVLLGSGLVGLAGALRRKRIKA